MASSSYLLAGEGLLKDKVLAVTGGSQGIGRAVSLCAAAHGAKVIVHYLGDAATTQDAQSLQDEIDKMGREVALVPGNIADPATAQSIVKSAVDTFGRLDVLVSNAGICPFHEFLSMPDELWKTVQDVNLNGAYYAVKAAANQMAKQEPKGGSIVAISSISALVGGAEQCHYTPTKAGVKSLMESCATALGQYSIRCNSILPGTIRTAINKDDLAQSGKEEYMSKRTPLGRVGEADDIAGPTIFFASDLAKFVNGASLLVDGGLFVNLQ